MCGIAGLANCGDREVLGRMTHIQAHRGPDDSGLWEKRFPDGSYIGLGSRRLAILDLSADGHMPMCNEDRTVWITYNGEIYNFAELRRELQDKGHRFASNTDTEVIIHLYEQEGADCVQSPQWHVRICHLRSAFGHAGVISGARSFRSEALLLLPPWQKAGLRFRSESPAPRARNRCPA